MSRKRKSVAGKRARSPSGPPNTRHDPSAPLRIQRLGRFRVAETTADVAPEDIDEIAARQDLALKIVARSVLISAVRHLADSTENDAEAAALRELENILDNDTDSV